MFLNTPAEATYNASPLFATGRWRGKSLYDVKFDMPAALEVVETQRLPTGRAASTAIIGIFFFRWFGILEPFRCCRVGSTWSDAGFSDEPELGAVSNDHCWRKAAVRG
jgi:hypothetical protein